MYTFVPMAALELQDLPGLFTYAQAREAGFTKHALYRLRDEGRIEVLSRGLYRRSDRNLADLELREIAERAPEATLCLATALARHGLSDEIAQAYDVALPRGTRPPVTSAPVAWHSFERETFALGRKSLRLAGEGATLGLYSPERCIVDAFRTRGQHGPELAHEALRRWLRRPGNHANSLLKLAAHFPRTVAPIRKALEILL